MRVIRSNGRELTVREVGEVDLRLRPRYANAPLPILDLIEEDDAARERVRKLLQTGLYERG